MTIGLDFIAALQFLTRIRLTEKLEYSVEQFGRSVKYFPLVGAVLGGLFLIVLALCQWAGIPLGYALAAFLVLADLLVTGGLHCDGFMDTLDGVLSAASREDMLAVMKDSRVGAYGAAAFYSLMLWKYSLFLDLAPAAMPLACWAAPVTARLAVVLAITQYPYARAQGLGKAFYQYAPPYTAAVAAGVTLLLLLPVGWQGCLAALGGIGAAGLFTRYIAGLLGEIGRAHV